MHWLINLVVSLFVYFFLHWLNIRTFKLKTSNGGFIPTFTALLPINLLNEHKYFVLMGVLFGLWVFIVEVSFPWLGEKFHRLKK
jgi:hypothetical protein